MLCQCCGVSYVYFVCGITQVEETAELGLRYTQSASFWLLTKSCGNVLLDAAVQDLTVMAQICDTLLLILAIDHVVTTDKLLRWPSLINSQRYFCIQNIRRFCIFKWFFG